MFEGDTCLCLFLLLVEEELARVRSAFVWRVSTEILKQLLEALVSDGVLNELEKESILEGNPVRADKARCFIDTVRKKGDKASRIMVRHLQTIDLSLFSQLRLYSDPSAQQGESTFLCSLLRCEV
uniref:CARD domain-containing protein n=1 Tax=Maylandia zebra TaxID=106582 RepID=A0A3P9DF14_9CICH